MSVEQDNIFNEVSERKSNVFITASAGYGKSHLTRRILNSSLEDTVVCAPTGVAALNVGGMTAHRMFSLPFGFPSNNEINRISKTTSEIFSGGAVKRIIIDEAPMIRADHFDLIDTKLRIATKKDIPFGGIQIVTVGDFHQLEPVINEEVFYKYYENPFIFSSDAWDFKTRKLTHCFRQENLRHVKILNSIRSKDINYKRAVDEINSIALPYNKDEEVLHLCNYRKDAEIINNKYYDNNFNKEWIFKAKITGKWSDDEHPVDVNLKLKVGLKVLIKSNSDEGGYVNGDKGIIKYISNSRIVVGLNSGKDVFISTNTWEKFKYKTGSNGIEKSVEASFEQFPIMLGYACSVHSAQGSTIEDCAIDFGRGCFSHGQAYVALSRIKDLTRIRLKRKIRYSDIICRDEVKKFYMGF